MSKVSIEDAQARLAELIRDMSPGDELIITAGSRPVARLTTTTGPQETTPRQPGTLSGTVTWMAPDFDAPVPEFQGYMP